MTTQLPYAVVILLDNINKRKNHFVFNMSYESDLYFNLSSIWCEWKG